MIGNQSPNILEFIHQLLSLRIYDQELLEWTLHYLKCINQHDGMSKYIFEIFTDWFMGVITASEHLTVQFRALVLLY